MPEGKAPHFPQQPVARQNDDGSLELECFLDASPQPDIKWFYDNVSMVIFTFFLRLCTILFFDCLLFDVLLHKSVLELIC
ncbi:unnamed protein product [Cylicostephanus goldi]|uniref:Ig-like domain-containing protein n=1 Tax=Cylicostephanus goldi TaxID=71465 RepID=A0A3P6R9U7_CYLGO|nr:unnamed protein product [Cylicostephanus goldi]